MSGNQPIDIDEAINRDIQNEIANTQGFIQKVRKENPTTNLSDQQLKEMYDDFNNGGFVIF